MERDPSAQEELRSLGLRAVPVTVVGERAVVGFNPQELARLLGLRPLEPAPTAGSPERFRRVLPAAVRAVRQLPDECLPLASPDRGRTLRELAYHIFAYLELVMEAGRTGRLDEEAILRYEEGSRPFTSSAALARYGAGVVERFLFWLEGLTPRERERPVDAYYGRVPLSQALDLALGHTAHHLRQLYELLRGMGVEPDRPLTEGDLEGIALPSQLW